MEKGLVVLQGAEPRAGTLIMSQGFKVEHRALRKLVIKYKTDFEELGVITSRVQKPTSKEGGRPTEEFMLSEDQAMYLGTLLTNNETVRRFKIALVKEFSRMKKALVSKFIQAQNTEWLEKRASGKLIRRQETDTIKNFVEYATFQGSQNAKMYYMNISKMENKALFILEQEFPNLRQILNLTQLSVIECADKIVSKALRDGMTNGTNYKDIYQDAKKLIESFAIAIGKTLIPAFQITQNQVDSKLKLGIGSPDRKEEVAQDAPGDKAG